MRTRNIAAIATGLWLSGSAGAHEVNLGFFSTFEYDDNIFNSENDPLDDVVFRVGPILGIKNTQGDLAYEVRYEPRWESYIDQSGLDAWDHSVFARATWRVASQTKLEATERFLYTRSVNRSLFIADPTVEFATPDPDFEFDRELSKQNSVSLALAHNWTERLDSRVTLNQSIYRVNGDDRFDSDTLDLQGETGYTITAKDRVGGGAGVTWQSFEPNDGSAGGSDTFIYHVFGLWTHTFSPTLTLTARVGPSLIDTEEKDFADSGVVPAFPSRRTSGGIELPNAATCPRDDGVPIFDEDQCRYHVNPDSPLTPQQEGPGIRGQDASAIANAQKLVFLDDEADDAGTRLTYFANIELVKRWERVRTILAYSRNESTSSGVGQSTVLDVLTGQVLWTPTPLWTLAFLAQVALRQSATDELGQAIGIQSATITGSEVHCCLNGQQFVFTYPGSESVSLRLIQLDDSIHVRSYTVSMRVTRKLNRHAEAFGVIGYLMQDSTEGETGARRFDNFRALLGFRWMFDPLIL